jgi:DNA repair ATPase RecN
MQDIQEIFNRIQQTKKEQKKLKDMFRDALKNHQHYQSMIEELNAMREKKKKLEEQIRMDFNAEFNKLDNLKADIDNDSMLISDIAITKFLKGESVQIIDEKEQKYDPVFSVKFKKAG